MGSIMWIRGESMFYNPDTAVKPRDQLVGSCSVDVAKLALASLSEKYRST